MSRYEFIRVEKAFPVTVLCGALRVSRAAYYAWLHRKPSPRQKLREDLRLKVKVIHERSRRTYGSPRVHEQLRTPASRSSYGAGVRQWKLATADRWNADDSTRVAIAMRARRQTHSRRPL